ncbi:MAG: hypothetical protein A3H98_12265 [Bacteroidetes bacterium RIFCSPLOWO2_02_FULL_36_8]|nr:MAG: hypothetical protein A3H98_12265 [Bacteroidetes bacterium RIFCSPLOWO2_02_FULL_36_8]OFY69851.1 MAG: hypothetical protein A3G23_07460 [Bacteroidetes bacterium RIFCSPLOWO2_12_FULL_37_12]
MAIAVQNMLEIIEVMENFINKNRPPENIRHKVDLSYKIEKQSVIVFELRPLWCEPKEIMECNIAKTTFVNTKKYWKVFWQRADLKWHGYRPKYTVKTISDFVNLIEKDEYGCFRG